MNTRWHVTHEINHSGGDLIEVFLDADENGYGPAYQRDEWEAEIEADYECTPRGWVFLGQPFHGGVFKVGAL